MINGVRLVQHLQDLSQIGRNEKTGGINRFSFTPEEKQAIELVTTYMEQAGMNVTIDAVGNLIGTYGEGNETIMLGSHIDTVPEGGKYDGALGVLAAIEVVHTMHEQQLIPSKKIQVVAFKDEEGTRFGFGLLGSSAMAGLLTEEQLQHTDEAGISIEEAMKDFHLSPYPLTQVHRNDIKAYLEMHIEQGKVLENEDLPVGVVTGIAAPLWLEVTVTGVSEHAGATPMPIRQDALTAASEMILAIEQLLTNTTDSVATVGKLTVSPNGTNVIPGKVTFSIDLRDIDENKVSALEQEIMQQLQQIAERRHVSLASKVLQRIKPAKTDALLQQQLTTSIEKQGIRPYSLISGAGHDAMNIAEIAPIGMLFVRSKDGISHNPLEYSSDEDIIVATNIFYDTVVELAK
ncbi:MULTISPECIES: Zn-dependent hydrolase [Lysinibacillus]|uniref:Zn-dependent hydrolase n=1 Tax=Lysinibacillus TaxID=400634 RepID=UPI0006CA328F|nr:MULTISPECIES: Zn-dependent hydrolase [Lysinibacillus]AUS88734.1 Zn-dependent hydrolase [Lysinibacillus sp. YS11]MCT1540114.1 Zn-dependent hydrolase [Lysinibacillus capsici]MCT1570996.1 Zn-dependent hydrolase [Lysinibacillus capsici]MCT1648587.1 Zn-dependent hydrolase [Lysinibacillus capsici]MCT1727129.1 Zn-dependent hydrolase [Lysinibacillus capsici]